MIAIFGERRYCEFVICAARGSVLKYNFAAVLFVKFDEHAEHTNLGCVNDYRINTGTWRCTNVADTGIYKGGAKANCLHFVPGAGDFTTTKGDIPINPCFSSFLKVGCVKDCALVRIS